MWVHMRCTQALGALDGHILLSFLGEAPSVNSLCPAFSTHSRSCPGGATFARPGSRTTLGPACLSADPSLSQSIALAPDVSVWPWRPTTPQPHSCHESFLRCHTSAPRRATGMGRAFSRTATPAGAALLATGRTLLSPPPSPGSCSSPGPG